MQKVIKTNILPQIISIVFHPVFMPLFAVFILFRTESRIGYMQDIVKNYIYGLITISLVLIPLIVVLAMHSLKLISSVYMEKSEERVFPLLILSLSAFVSYYFFSKGSVVPNIIVYFIFSVALNALVAGVISKFWKISTHMIGIGGVLAFIVLTAVIYWIDIQYIFILLVLASGIVAYARLKLQQHSATQIYLGFLTGISITLGCLLFLIY